MELLRHHLDGYGYETLLKSEARLFDKCFRAEGEDHREFCELFGPGKILGSLWGFLNYFMIRRVMAGANFMRASGTVTKKLPKWLAQKGYVSEESARQTAQIASRAARDLDRAERAANILAQAADELFVDPDDLDDQDYLDFDHFTIAKMEPGNLWLEPLLGATHRILGPVPVPERATELLDAPPPSSHVCTSTRLHVGETTLGGS